MTEAPQFDLTPIRALYPFTSRYARTRRGVMHYLDEGSGPGTPVLLLHGNPTWSFAYRDLIRALSGDRRVIAPDHLGLGLSARPGGMRLADHIAALGELVRQLGLDRVDLVVHDWGGAIGFGAAVRQHIRPRRIVVLNTAAFLSPRVPRRIALCMPPVLGELGVIALNGFVRAGTVMTVTRALPPLVRAGYQLPYRRRADRGGVLEFVRDIPRRPQHPTWPVVAAIDAGLPALAGVPLMLLWGGRDWCFDDHFLGEWRARFPAAPVTRIAEAGHYVFEDAAEVLRTRVRAWFADGGAGAGAADA
ncbi:MAG: alpha/beta fold hydrolase [Chloroflexi bacterium]|nr:alpha/beta fold hydrolase [Chloroflexota bacterium]